MDMRFPNQKNDARGGRPPPRIAARPNAVDWRDDEVLTLPEAAVLFFPDGPLVEKSLRVAARDGDLAISRIAGKVFTTAGAVREMIRPARAPGATRARRPAAPAPEPPPEPPPEPAPEAAPPPSPRRGKAARDPRARIEAALKRAQTRR
jgi:hypothetical protein